MKVQIFSKGATLTVIFGLFSLSLLGCNTSEADHIAPTITFNLNKSQGIYRFGVTDTIVVNFSEKIDTLALGIEPSPPDGITHKFASATKLKIFGKNQKFGSSQFNINSPFTLALLGLQDQHGNGQTRVQESFLAYPWVDKDMVDTTFVGLDSLFSSRTTWVDGSSITDSIITEGGLDDKKLFGKHDYFDLKLLSISFGDTLFASLSTRSNLNLALKIAGPFSKAGLDSAISLDNQFTWSDSLQTGSIGKASVRIVGDFATYIRKFGPSPTVGLFVFFIEIPRDQEGFYRLSARIHPFK